MPRLNKFKSGATIFLLLEGKHYHTFYILAVFFQADQPVPWLFWLPLCISPYKTVVSMTEKKVYIQP